MNRVEHGIHLVRRFVGALSRKAPPTGDDAWARSLLEPAEVALWERMSNADRRHSIEVARRFLASVDGEDRDATVAALLHDVGKIESGLGTFGRVAATVVGPRTSRFRRYHDHERIGAEMVRSCGGSPRTAALIDGTSPDAVSLAALRAADDI
ncbi:MAG TPA: HDIG domain-containing protein [Ilumatobacteraceae bacterium]|jgi:putative nucleotidyltransferase with HDIG domain